MNRGRIPLEYEFEKMHWTPANQEESVEGILMLTERSEKDIQDAKASNSNIRIDLEEFAKKTQLSNTELVHKIYLKSV